MQMFYLTIAYKKITDGYGAITGYLFIQCLQTWYEYNVICK